MTADDLAMLSEEVRKAFDEIDECMRMDIKVVPVGALGVLRAELLRLARENARLNKIESLATEQRLQMEDVELYLMEVSQPDDEDAPWCDRMKSAIELLVQDCNDAVGQKNKAEAELAALKARIAEADKCYAFEDFCNLANGQVDRTRRFASIRTALPESMIGQNFALVPLDDAEAAP